MSNQQLPQVNTRNKMDGLEFLRLLPTGQFPLVFFDPQYRSVLDKQKYGNEGKGRLKARLKLPQMSNELINKFFIEIERILKPSGHVMLWVDKFILLNSIHLFTSGTSLQVVDLITWDKKKIGLGYRTRRQCEYLVIMQKPPIKVRGIWMLHNIPDIWDEKIENKNHAHSKPIQLQKKLIEAVTNKADIIVDPCAGSYSVFIAAGELKRNFLGCDFLG